MSAGTVPLLPAQATPLQQGEPPQKPSSTANLNLTSTSPTGERPSAPPVATSPSSYSRLSLAKVEPFQSPAEKRDTHISCVILTLTVWFLITLAYLQSATSPPSGDISRTVLLVGILVSYTAYLVENLRSSTFTVLLGLRSAPHPAEYLDKLRIAPPVLTHSVTGWHSARVGVQLTPNRDESARDRVNVRNRPVDNNWSPVVSVSSFPQLYRVNTFFHAEPFSVRQWKDASDWAVLSLPTSIEAFGSPIVYLHISKTVHYMDYDTELCARNQAEYLCEQNRNHDQYLDFAEHYSVPGLSSEPILCCGQRRRKNMPKLAQVSEMASGVNTAASSAGCTWVTAELHRSRAAALERSSGRAPSRVNQGPEIEAQSSSPNYSTAELRDAGESHLPKRELPLSLSPYLFLVVTIFMMAWPYRIYLDRNTRNISFVLRKVVSVAEKQADESSVFT